MTRPLAPREVFQKLLANIEQVICGQTVALRNVLAALASDGHVLLDDFPGTGKPPSPRHSARSIDAQFKRVQFTPDLLPSDILGVSIYNQREQAFEFHDGPVFTNILLAGRNQSRLAPHPIGVARSHGRRPGQCGGRTAQFAGIVFRDRHPEPGRVSRNYPLPEAQMDRFALQFTLGYVAPEQEVAILSAQTKHHPLERLSSCVSTADVLALKTAVKQIRIGEELKRYIVDLTGATRRAAGVQLGASPRASLALMKAAQALALFDGLDFVTPDQIQEIAVAVMAHRLALEPQAKFSGTSAGGLVAEVLRKVPVPA